MQNVDTIKDNMKEIVKEMKKQAKATESTSGGRRMAGPRLERGQFSRTFIDLFFSLLYRSGLDS